MFSSSIVSEGRHLTTHACGQVHRGLACNFLMFWLPIVLDHKVCDYVCHGECFTNGVELKMDVAHHYSMLQLRPSRTIGCLL